MKKAKILLIIATIMYGLIGCANGKHAEGTNDISIIHGQFAIDVYSYEELAGSAGYVIIGKVLKEIGTEYRLRNASRNGEKASTPYTNYSIEVVENLKGNLRQDVPIEIKKRGGVKEDGTGYELFTDDLLPVEGETYVFYIYAQSEKSEHGTGINLVCGPNSTIPVEDGQRTEINTLSISDKELLNNVELLDEVRAGVANQIVSDRERSVSNDDVSAK